MNASPFYFYSLKPSSTMPVTMIGIFARVDAWILKTCSEGLFKGTFGLGEAKGWSWTLWACRRARVVGVRVGVANLQIAALGVGYFFTSLSCPVRQLGHSTSIRNQQIAKQSTSHEQVLFRFGPDGLLVPPHLRLWHRVDPDVLPLLLWGRWPQLLSKPQVLQSL